MNLIEVVNAIKDTDFKICRKKRAFFFARKEE